MLMYPSIDPVALHVGPLKIYWYGLMYLVGFFAAWVLLTYRARACPHWTADDISEILFYGALGAVVGGRLGCVLFFGLPDYLAHPLEIFAVWKGGMSFHGGLLGVAVALWIFSRKHHKLYFAVMDFVAPVVPAGLGAGRIGNFINGELWGRPTDMPWGMIFPHVDLLPRHPSQWYEFFLEGVLLFAILWFYSAKPKPRMAVSGLFLVCYGLFRIIAECFRYPDPPWDLIVGGLLTMGQVLSAPMVLLGIILLALAYKGKVRENIS